MPRIDQETVNKILDTADIVEVVSDFVKLRRSGANYKGLCPFHNERTPSFSVNKARNICKCFSCGKGGSPVGFIMEHEQMSYVEALRWLARKYNIEIVEHEQTDAEREAASVRESMFAVNEFALQHFERNLTDTDEGRNIALAYFRRRGISDAMIRKFHLGYSLERSNALQAAALSKGFPEQILIDTGLCIRSERGSVYDRFKSRVIFPVHTVSGRVVAFGGRTMRSDKQLAKYVNSPESTIYSKKKEIYGLYQAKSAIARKDKAIMVEGYMDVISMHQAGVENVVASSGTSLTQEQIRAIMRFTRNMTVIYDADPAGIKASLRGIKLILAEGLNVRALLLPPGEDPDSFAQTHNSDEVEEYLRTHEQDIIAFMSDILLKDVAPNDPIDRAGVINTILETVAMVDDQIMRMEYVAQCARTFGMSEDAIALQLQRFMARRLETLEKEAARARAMASLTPEQRESSQREEAESRAETVQADNTGDIPAGIQGVSSKSADAVPLMQLNRNELLPYEKILLKYAVRYGLQYLCETPDSDGSMLSMNVVHFIDRELKVDSTLFSDPTVARVFATVLEIADSPEFSAEHARMEEQFLNERAEALEEGRNAIRSSGSSVAEIEKADTLLIAKLDAELYEKLDRFDMDYLHRILCSSPDDDLRHLATDLIAEKHHLSKIHSKFAHIETEQQQLMSLIPRAIYEYKAAILALELRDLRNTLDGLDPSDMESYTAILKKIISLQQLQADFAKTNGERIILPKK